MTDLVKAVREHANANYNKDGWDILVECWSDEDIESAIGLACTARQAIGRCKRIVGTVDQYRAEIKSTAW